MVDYVAKAREIGYLRGTDATQWALQPMFLDREQDVEGMMRGLVEGLNRGDPIIFDLLPSATIWDHVHGYTAATLLLAVGIAMDDDLVGAVFDAYLQGYQEAMETETRHIAEGYLSH